MTVLSPLADWGSPAVQDVPRHRPPPRAGLRAWAARNWLGLCALALITANDYKFRVRSPSETLSGGADLFILAEIAIYAIVAAYLVLSQPGLPRPPRPPLAVLLTAAYVALIVASVSYSPFKSLAAVRALETLVLFGLVATACARADRGDLHRFAHGFLVLVAGSVVYGVVFPSPPVTSTQAGRFSWLQVHPITAGVFVGIAVLLALTYLLTRRRPRPGPLWSAWVYLFLLVVVAGGLIGTQTRNSVLGVTVGAFVLLCCLYRGRRLAGVLFGVALAAATVSLLASERIVEYFVRGESAERLATLNSRTTLWSEAYAAIAEQPVFGYGLSASRGIFLEETGLGGGHNAVLNVGVDLGLLGLVVWGSLLLTVVGVVARIPFTAPEGVGVDRALVLATVAFLVVGGIFFEGLGAVANVAANWLFLLVAWAVVLDLRSVPRQRRRAWPFELRSLWQSGPTGALEGSHRSAPAPHAPVRPEPLGSAAVPSVIPSWTAARFRRVD